jgi:hypothetical protein
MLLDEAVIQERICGLRDQGLVGGEAGKASYLVILSWGQAKVGERVGHTAGPRALQHVPITCTAACDGNDMLSHGGGLHNFLAAAKKLLAYVTLGHASAT